MAALQHLLDVPDGDKVGATKSGPTRTYIHDARAMTATQVDIKEPPVSYSFVVNMPGLGTWDVKIQGAGDQR